jgi:hypothetical protein
MANAAVPQTHETSIHEALQGAHEAGGVTLLGGTMTEAAPSEGCSIMHGKLNLFSARPSAVEQPIGRSRGRHLEAADLLVEGRDEVHLAVLALDGPEDCREGLPSLVLPFAGLVWRTRIKL